MNDINELKLCYVEGSWAYFTSQPLEEAWGDDWNDAPYEHNAGSPYYWRPKQYAVKDPATDNFVRWEDLPEDEQSPKWEIVKVAWEGPFETPDERVLNSGYSVQMINRGDVAWLRPSSWVDSSVRPILAGTSYNDFIDMVRAGGGEVFVSVTSVEMVSYA